MKAKDRRFSGDLRDPAARAYLLSLYQEGSSRLNTISCDESLGDYEIEVVGTNIKLGVVAFDRWMQFFQEHGRRYDHKQN